jgi:hypothetical protein
LWFCSASSSKVSTIAIMAKAKKALEAKEKGNQLFKSGRIEE